MSDDSVRVPTWTPPRWMNIAMGFLLRTPGLQRLLGRATALITFTGRRSGRRYTTPVTYTRSDDAVIILSKKFRTWWRNLASHPEVELRLAGEVVRGHAEASRGDASALATLIEYLQSRPRDAKFYGVRLGPDGEPDERDARALLPQIVVVRVALR